MCESVSKLLLALCCTEGKDLYPSVFLWQIMLVLWKYEWMDLYLRGNNIMLVMNILWQTSVTSKTVSGWLQKRRVSFGPECRELWPNKPGALKWPPPPLLSSEWQRLLVKKRDLSKEDGRDGKDLTQRQNMTRHQIYCQTGMQVCYTPLWVRLVRGNTK